MKRNLLAAPLFLASLAAGAQERQDSIRVHVLDSVRVISSVQQHLSEIQGVYIFSGKKTNDLFPDAGSANLAQNSARMVFARIPGLNVWEMDGAGTQVNIGARGTDTHRSIEMNMRQNGYNTNSDMFGYPEDHYTPPMPIILPVASICTQARASFPQTDAAFMCRLG